MHIVRRSVQIIGLALLILGGGPGAGRAAVLAPAGQLPPMNGLITMALDNQGNGWAWAGDPSPNVNGHLLRLENGAWREILPSDPGAATLLKTTVTLYQIVLTGKGDTGWATGSGGGQRIWHLQNGVWSLVPSPLPAGAVLQDMALSADGSTGWLLASGSQAADIVLTLRNGTWTVVPSPPNVALWHLVLSPDGKSGWGSGPNRTTRATMAIRLSNGQWLDAPDQQQPLSDNARPVTCDNAGNGWVLGAPIRSSLTRLTPGAPPQTVAVQPAVSQGTLVDVIFHEAAVDGQGRGWVSGVVQVADAPPGSARLSRPLLLWVDGDQVSEVPLAGVNPVRDPDPELYLGPLAISPGGGYSWLGVSDDNARFLALTQLREPWLHSQPPAAPAPLSGAAHCFAEVAYCLRGPFARYWEQNGGLDQFGFPVTPEVIEQQDGKSYTVQYTERARFEYHPENNPPYDVLLGLLGNTLADPRAAEAPFQPKPASAQADTQWFKETQHNLGPPFLTYWQAHGGLPVFGLPRSEAFDEKNAADGKTYRVQYFERNRIEYHPENKGTKFEYLLGLLGVEQFRQTYGYTP